MDSSSQKKSGPGFRVCAIIKDIKPAHTVFALPFVFAGAALAFQYEGFFDTPGFIWKMLWISAAAFGARSTAMAFNRLVDAEIDAKNPRTANRPIPAGIVSGRDYAVFIIISAGLFFLSAAMLNFTALALSPVVIIIVCGYSFTKHFTALTHFFLGLSLGLAPAGAWIAVTAQPAGLEIPALLGAAVLTWVAGFDMIYACRDCDVDRRLSVHSFPARFGLAGTLTASALSHAAMVVILIILWAIAPPLGMIFIAGLIPAAALLVIEHLVVRPDDLSRVDTAFFTLNALVSVVLAAAIIIDCLL